MYHLISRVCQIGGNVNRGLRKRCPAWFPLDVYLQWSASWWGRGSTCSSWRRSEVCVSGGRWSWVPPAESIRTWWWWAGRLNWYLGRRPLYISSLPTHTHPHTHRDDPHAEPLCFNVNDMWSSVTRRNPIQVDIKKGTRVRMSTCLSLLMILVYWRVINLSRIFQLHETHDDSQAGTHIFVQAAYVLQHFIEPISQLCRSIFNMKTPLHCWFATEFLGTD